MAAYDPVVVRGYLAVVDAPPTHAAKGKAFEDLACYLLGGIPGVRITARNSTNTFATQEIDVACLNENDPAGLGALVDFFLVECKGWDDAVTSMDVSWFLTKIRHRGVKFGILIAANGITGEPEHLSRAHFLVAAELAVFGIKMVIITRDEIEAVASGEDFGRLIIQKVCGLIASGGRCYRDVPTRVDRRNRRVEPGRRRRWAANFDRSGGRPKRRSGPGRGAISFSRDDGVEQVSGAWLG